MSNKQQKRAALQAAQNRQQGNGNQNGGASKAEENKKSDEDEEQQDGDESNEGGSDTENENSSGGGAAVTETRPAFLDIGASRVPYDAVAKAAMNRTGLTQEQWDAKPAVEQSALVETELKFARGQMMPAIADRVAISEEQVQVHVPRQFNLRVDHSHVVTIPQGVQMLSRTLAEHPYAQKHGVKPWNPQAQVKT